HAVEALTRELAAAPLDEPEMRRELAPVRVAERTSQAAEPEGRGPAGGVAEDLRHRGELLAGPSLRLAHCAPDLEMLVDGLARHEQMHDLARALEDEVDARVPHQALDGHGKLAAAFQRALRLVAASAADLEGPIDQLPRADGVPLLGGRRFEPDV